MDWKWFIERAEEINDPNVKVRISVETENGFSKSMDLTDFVDFVSQCQKITDFSNQNGLDPNTSFADAVGLGMGLIREKAFISNIKKGLSLKYPDLYIRIEWHEANEYFIGFYGFEGDEKEVVIFLDNLQETFDKDENFYLLPFFHTCEATKRYYPKYVGKKGVETF